MRKEQCSSSEGKISGRHSHGYSNLGKGLAPLARTVHTNPLGAGWLLQTVQGCMRKTPHHLRSPYVLSEPLKISVECYIPVDVNGYPWISIHIHPHPTKLGGYPSTSIHIHVFYITVFE
jgi:hypothetical protein